MTDFADFGLSRPILEALATKGLTDPTPIQTGAIPALLEGHDVIGLAQTGSGKTAAFTLPLLQRLADTPSPRGKGNPPRGLILAPTRELAAQCLEQVRVFAGRMRVASALAIGGVSIHKQKAEIRRGLDILVATPGRLVDLMDQNALSLDAVEYFVLDEVDQMLDLGFIPSIRKIARRLPADRQNVFFSATMAKPIEKLAHSFLNDPVEVRVESGPKPKIHQQVVYLTSAEKMPLLISTVQSSEFKNGLIFTRTKRGADRVSKSLNAAGLEAHPIHGNRSQSQRERALSAFKSGRANLLVATDIAARGIDIAGVSHVINYDLPATPETYVHRIGRTGRAGASGTSLSFCLHDELMTIRAIERLTGTPLTVIGEGPQAMDMAPRPPQPKRKPRRRKPAANAAKPAASASSKPQAKAKTKSSGKPKAAERAGGEGRPQQIRRRRRKGPSTPKLRGAA